MKLTTKNVMWVCFAMALAAALVYLLMFLDVMHPGDLVTEEGLPAFFLIIPACYAIGGLLALVKKRWIWITGAIINAFTIIIFYTMYSAQPEIMFSAPGLISKIAQAILEAGLIYLAVTYKRQKTAS